MQARVTHAYGVGICMVMSICMAMVMIMHACIHARRGVRVGADMAVRIGMMTDV